MDVLCDEILRVIFFHCFVTDFQIFVNGNAQLWEKLAQVSQRFAALFRQFAHRPGIDTGSLRFDGDAFQNSDYWVDERYELRFAVDQINMVCWPRKPVVSYHLWTQDWFVKKIAEELYGHFEPADEQSHYCQPVNPFSHRTMSGLGILYPFSLTFGDLRPNYLPMLQKVCRNFATVSCEVANS